MAIYEGKQAETITVNVINNTPTEGEENPS